MLNCGSSLGNDCVKRSATASTIYIYTEEPRVSITQVEECSYIRTIRHSIRNLEPSLEDVFMSLMRQQGKEDDDVDY